ncbi:hypothetical protein ACFFX0_32860 [Citricoccus parietis]|uniref:Uncharacterized protein n=1 Tax=Citricoccus parietis TaxID=592307 RepID=A0ABV5G9R3_9MICC
MGPWRSVRTLSMRQPTGPLGHYGVCVRANHSRFFQPTCGSARR